MNSRRTLGDTIADLRKSRGWNQEQLATTLHITRTLVSHWETNRRSPTTADLQELARVLDDDGELAAMADAAERVRGIGIEEPLPVDALIRRAANGLLGQLVFDEAVDGRPAYGWRGLGIDATDPRVAALSTAYGLKALLLAGLPHPTLSLPALRETLRRLELRHGGWSGWKATLLPRAEDTTVVLSVLRAAGEEDNFVADRIGLATGALDRHVASRRPTRPYVLATALVELAELPIEDSLARRYIEVLVDLAIANDDECAWPMARAPGDQPSPQTLHTAMAVCALVAWADRLDDAELRGFAESGRRWLERNQRLDLDDETIAAERVDGDEELRPVHHFTPAWVVRGLVGAGASPSRAAVTRALDALLSHLRPEVGLWWWPRSGGFHPVWMTHHGVAALAAWARSHDVS